MALKLRRGTNAERTAITPVAGELVYTTDTKKVWVGDGSTVGGNIVTGQNDIVDDTTPQLGGNLDLNGNNITGTGNINITGTVTASGNINLGDGAGGDIIAVGGVVQGALIPDVSVAYNQGSNIARWNTGFFSSLDVLGHIQADSIQGDLIADDSTVSWNQTTNQFSGIFVGTLEGDVNGSLFADNSTLMVDGVNNLVVADVNNTRVTTGDAIVSNATGSNLRLNYNAVGASANTILGQLVFQDQDVSKAIIQGRQGNIYITAADNGAKGVTIYETHSVHGGMKLRINPTNTVFTEPTEALQVDGNAIISGVIDAASFRGSLVADDSTTIVDAINSTITVGSFVQFGSMTTAVRDAITAANGMVIYNTTLNKFQGYENGAWASLI
jgi:hypothetical protein